MRLTRPGARKTRGRDGKREAKSCDKRSGTARCAGESVIFSIAKKTLSLARIGKSSRWFAEGKRKKRQKEDKTAKPLQSFTRRDPGPPGLLREGYILFEGESVVKPAI